jgi:hypothetical protein
MRRRKRGKGRNGGRGRRGGTLEGRGQRAPKEDKMIGEEEDIEQDVLLRVVGAAQNAQS